MTEVFWSVPNKTCCFSELDQHLTKTWETVRDKNIMRYRIEGLGTQKTRTLMYKGLSIIAQLATERASTRRAPQEVTDIDQPFDNKSFNFTKIDSQEILLEKDNIHVIVNTSPVDYGSCLIIPNLELCLPQKITEFGLQASLNTLIRSNSWCMRVGFNSLTAYASVNHQHYHIYYLNQHLGVEMAAVKPLFGDTIYEFLDWPAKGFAFQLKEFDSLSLFISNVWKLVEYLQQNRIAHNMFITRGCPFEEEPQADTYTAVRLFIWAREPSFGIKERNGFNPALCELAGHILVKDETSFERITVEEAAEILSNVTTTPFESVKNAVNLIYS
ncbi:GDP-D-glucose phosphorylase 1-like isoform X2 [Artemia franciscana]|uniref:GDP-D-glucose phosphorylase 1 n=3 Tax=Artemia franciscana TaxID=6661 RepID=A0AA88HHY4_ARTSF|nr:hypothetical protein QYM36_012680 [Artemia franciscana]KAK2711608.1 hypothetical protein QYM36_012680 [Artemia franciscana]